ncbi:MAG: RNA 2',3'-cyclic phosphodiesterase [Polyangiaceae bacterium]|nr:RNA 2',3'-cyclic phosphodiesterase [Polyangiaceae bacterium]
MTDQLRLFFAMPLPPVALSALCAAQERMKRRAIRSRLSPHWTRPENLHVTLKFLGSMDRAVLPELVALLETEARGLDPIETRTTGMTGFSSPKRARVVVATLEDARGLVARLARNLEQGVERHGIALETRPFRTHVTVARLRMPGDISEWIDHAALGSTSGLFEEARLYSSELKPTGAVYRCLAAARFGGAS